MFRPLSQVPAGERAPVHRIFLIPYRITGKSGDSNTPVCDTAEMLNPFFIAGSIAGITLSGIRTRIGFLVITQSPKFVHPFVCGKADRHTHLSQEWSEYCANPNQDQPAERSQEAIQVREKSIRSLLLASLHVETEAGNTKMVYAAIFLRLQYQLYGHVHVWTHTERVVTPIAYINTFDTSTNSKTRTNRKVKAMQVSTTVATLKLNIVADGIRQVDWSRWPHV